MTKIKNEKTINANETNNSLSRLSESYYKEAEKLDTYIGKLKAELKARPEPDELYSLEKRLEILRCEKRELMNTALQLARLAAPPSEHPSLLHREREAS